MNETTELKACPRFERHSDRDSITVTTPCTFALDMYHSGEHVLIVNVGDKDHLIELQGSAELTRLRTALEGLLSLATVQAALDMTESGREAHMKAREVLINNGPETKFQWKEGR